MSENLTYPNTQEASGFSHELAAELEAIQAEQSEASVTLPEQQSAPSAETAPEKPQLTPEQAAELNGNLDSILSYEHPEPAEIAALLEQAAAAELPGLPDRLNSLRHARSAGGENRGNLNNSHLDGTVATLLLSGHDELATSLISSSPKEAQNFNHASQFVTDNPDEMAAITAKAESISAAKRAKLRATLESSGAETELINGLIDRAGDPDDAATVTPDAWKGLGRVHPETIIRMAENNYDLPGTVEIVGDLSAIGLTAEASKLVPRMLKDDEPAARTAYLASYRHARDAIIDPHDTYPKHELVQRVDMLVDFADPSAALDATHKIYGADPSLVDIKKFSDLCPKNDYTNEVRTFTPEFTDSVALTRTALAELPIEKDYQPDILAKIGEAIRDSEDPQHEAQLILANLQAGRAAIERDRNVVYAVTAATDREHFASALQAAEGITSAVSLEESLGIIQRLSSQEDAMPLASSLDVAAEALKERNLTIEDVTSTAVMDTISTLRRDKPDITPGEIKAGIEKLCQNHLTAAEAKTAYADQYEARLKMTDTERRSTSRSMDIGNFPETANRLAALGFDEATSKRLFDTWGDYNEMTKYQMNQPGHRSKPVNQITPSEYARMAEKHAEKLTAQVGAIETYAQKYGAEELADTMKAFGIANFDRYAEGQLHKQHEAWKAGILPVDNIVVSARRGDYNGAMSKVGKNYGEVAFADRNNVFFEAENGHGVSQAMTAVSRYERSHHREPDVQNVVVNGHAYAEGIVLGANHEGVMVQDYINADKEIAEANAIADKDPSALRKKRRDFRHELGDDYRVILQACSTASENTGGRKNIAEAISDGHDTQVEGSKLSTGGSITIDANNRITFATVGSDGEESGYTRSTTYGARHDQLPFVEEVKAALGPEADFDYDDMPEA